MEMTNYDFNAGKGRRTEKTIHDGIADLDAKSGGKNKSHNMLEDTVIRSGMI
jgi:hypothetical protein